MDKRCELTDVQIKSQGEESFVKPRFTVICGTVVRICPIHETLERLINDQWVEDEAA